MHLVCQFKNDRADATPNKAHVDVRSICTLFRRYLLVFIQNTPSS